MSELAATSNRLDRPVDDTRDHVLGEPGAPITLVEYGSYDCPHCRRANERITEVRSELLASALAVRLGLASKPAEYSWRQLAGAGALAGIGFTMSLFIAGQAFPAPSDFAAAKVAVFTASVLSTLIGVAVLWNAVAKEEAVVAPVAQPQDTGASP